MLEIDDKGVWIFVIRGVITSIIFTGYYGVMLILKKINISSVYFMLLIQFIVITLLYTIVGYLFYIYGGSM
ncbi:MAG: hypothetical protein FJX80_03770 [Bacteroidetes bacterium]|nr:hypothetical protein [Bacteroidota bacterium]